MTLQKTTNRFAETEIDDEIVLMNIDTGHFHALKATGLATWKLIDGTRDINALSEALRQRYAVDPDRCATEVGRFIDQMVEAGFVERS
jgi:hypothetical protein